MRIVCPSCQAIYDVPDALLTGAEGRPPAKLRCARCAAEWAAESAADKPDARPAPAPKPDGPTPSLFADAVAQAIPRHPPAASVAEPSPETPPPPPLAMRRPPSIDPTPPPPAGETLVAEHLATGRARRPAPPPRNPRDSATLLFAWCLSVGVLAALLIAAYIHRAEVIAFWPPAARAYDLLGLIPVTEIDDRSVNSGG